MSGLSVHVRLHWKGGCGGGGGLRPAEVGAPVPALAGLHRHTSAKPPLDTHARERYSPQSLRTTSGGCEVLVPGSR